MLALPSNDKSLLTALSFTDQLMHQGTSASLLPVSCSRTSHSSQKKEMGNTLLRAGHLPTSEIQIKLRPADQEEFLFTLRFKVENNEKNREKMEALLNGPHKKLLCALELLKTSNSGTSFGRTLCSIIKYPFCMMAG